MRCGKPTAARGDEHGDRMCAWGSCWIRSILALVIRIRIRIRGRRGSKVPLAGGRLNKFCEHPNRSTSSTIIAPKCGLRTPATQLITGLPYHAGIHCAQLIQDG